MQIYVSFRKTKVSIAFLKVWLNGTALDTFIIRRNNSLDFAYDFNFLDKMFFEQVLFAFVSFLLSIELRLLSAVDICSPWELPWKLENHKVWTYIYKYNIQ